MCIDSYFRKSLLFAIVAGVSFVTTMQAQTGGQLSIGPRAAVIDESGSYRLVADISLSANSLADAAIKITANSVTVDLNGHQLKGPGGLKGVGILIDGAKSVTVRNGHIAYMGIGVQVAGSSNVKVNGLNIRGQDMAVSAPPPEIGVMIMQSRNVEVEDLNISNVGLGIFVRGGESGGNRIANNTVTAGDNGVFGVCYNPTPSDPMGPRGDLVVNNLFSGYSVGVNLVPTAGYNVFSGNTIVFKTSAWESPNDTNIFQGNIERLLP